jgi:hypothetical protein
MEGQVTPAATGHGTDGGEVAEMAEAARRIRAEARRAPRERSGPACRPP